MTIATINTATKPAVYKILRNGRRYNNMNFPSYEAARKYALKKVRKLGLGSMTIYGNVTYAYPKLADAGFRVQKA